jgi:biopolymer transport protein TolR
MQAGRSLADDARDDGYAPMAEINVTPLVDVVLVLLIVFMVTAPLMVAGLPVDLPRASSAKLAKKPEPLILTIDKDGSVFLDDQPLALEALPETLAAAHSQDPEAVVQVRGDRATQYGQIVSVMDAVARAGIAKVSLLAASAPDKPAP